MEKKFFQSMIKYYKKSILRDICNVKDFRKNKKDLEFYQVGQKIPFPKWTDIFKEKEVGDSFVNGIIHNETEFILKEILNSEKINKYGIDDIDKYELSYIFSKIENPTHLFIPFKLSKKLLNLDNIKMIGSDKIPHIMLGNKKVQIIWVTDDIDKIIITDKKNIEITQKKLKDSKNIKGMKSCVKEKERLMIYKNKSSFVYRTVFSKPKLNKNSAIIIQVNG